MTENERKALEAFIAGSDPKATRELRAAVIAERTSPELVDQGRRAFCDWMRAKETFDAICEKFPREVLFGPDGHGDGGAWAEWEKAWKERPKLTLPA